MTDAPKGPEARPARKGLLDEVEEMARRRGQKKAKGPKGPLDLDRIG